MSNHAAWRWEKVPQLGRVIVGNQVEIGANATILPGVVIGRNSLVGAGSVVIHDVPEDTVVAGSPARVIKKVDELECFAGFFEKPYTWPAFTDAEKNKG